MTDKITGLPSRPRLGKIAELAMAISTPTISLLLRGTRYRPPLNNTPKPLGRAAIGKV